MNFRAKYLLWVTFCVLLGLMMAPDPVKAARYHVSSEGTRVADPSVPNNWSPENCYPTLAAACNSSAAEDSVLLFSENHFLYASISLPAFLGNMNLNNSFSDATVTCSATAQMVVLSENTSFLARGLTISSDGSDSDFAAFLFEGGFETGTHIVFESCFFNENQGSDVASRGGSCMFASGDGNGAILDISNSIFVNNVCRGKGGAIYLTDGYDVQIQDSVFQNNESRNRGTGAGLGGAIAVKSMGTQTQLFLTRVQFDGNKAWGPGGTIFIDDGSLSMVDCQLDNSQSAVDFFTEWSAGAGILMRRTGDAHLETIFLTVDGCGFDGSIGNIDTNPWAGDGGAILVKGIDDRYVDVNVTNSVFTNNYNAQGAGIYIGRFATGNVIRCKFQNNTAYLQGGATFKGGAFEANLGETAVYNYCEFSGNRAGLDVNGIPSTVLGRGGVFSNRLNTRAEFYNCTFYNNEAHGAMSDGDAIMLPAEGGEFWSDLQRCVLVNNVFYGENGNSVQVSADEGSISRVSYCASEAGEIETGGIAADGEVVLTSLPFQSSVILIPGLGSPLVDSALDTGQTMDLAGNLVPSGSGPDIGAYERNYWSTVPDFQVTEIVLSVHPNPFNPQTELNFEMDEPGFVNLEILDMAGRKVTTLVQGPFLGGKHRISWRGNDDRGQALASGVYFARIQIDGISRTKKLTLVR